MPYFILTLFFLPRQRPDTHAHSLLSFPCFLVSLALMTRHRHLPQPPTTSTVVVAVLSTPDPSPSLPLPESPPHLLLPHSLCSALSATLHGTVKPPLPRDNSGNATTCHRRALPCRRSPFCSSLVGHCLCLTPRALLEPGTRRCRRGHCLACPVVGPPPTSGRLTGAATALLASLLIVEEIENLKSHFIDSICFG